MLSPEPFIRPGGTYHVVVRAACIRPGGTYHVVASHASGPVAHIMLSPEPCIRPGGTYVVDEDISWWRKVAEVALLLRCILSNAKGVIKYFEPYGIR